MMTSKIVFFAICFILISCVRNRGCESFKEGHFLLQSDSLSSTTSFNVYRTGDEQIEIDQYNKKTYLSVNWISDCIYEVRTMPGKKNKMAYLTDSSVVKVVIYRSVGDTAFYKTYVLTDIGSIPAASGRMIKIEKDNAKSILKKK